VSNGPEQNTPVAASVSTSIGLAMMCVGMSMAILDVQVLATSFADDSERARHSAGSDELGADRVSDRRGRRDPVDWLPHAPFEHMLVVRAVRSVFTLASVGCAASDTFPALVAWLVLQGFSGGTLIPAVFAAVFLLFPLARQGLSTTFAGVLAVLAPTVGPIVGGEFRGYRGTGCS
jgi:DHA2 family multidrug resistance protein